MKHRHVLMLAAVLATPSLYAAPSGELRFSFTGTAAPGAILVQWHERTGAPLYDAALGYGFVAQTGALPARTVHTAEIRNSAGGFTITETRFDVEKGFEALHYNHFGMAFRIKAPPGAYAIWVRTTSSAPDTIVSVSGMQTSRLTAPVFWDAASLIPNRTRVTAAGRDWSYRYVNGREAIDIEIEPAKPGVAVGIEEIVLTPIAPQARPAGTLPTIFTLGDSTVKSYTFDEAPMSGWGQVFDALFDPRVVKVLNYSMGGRSFRNSYAEGRLNDLLLSGHVGDIVMIQFGHNDESADEARRFGRGATEAMYEAMIREVYLPAIRARGMVPVFVTPMSRVIGTQPGAQKADQPYVNSFKTRRFPELMKKLGAELGVTVVDLNARSVEYYNQMGSAAITAMVMSIEAGETPGKTNDGSYANGHPSNKIDGTHFKESLSKQYARLVVTELGRLAGQGDAVAARIVAALKPEVRAGRWSTIHAEIASDIGSGDGAYYRNQIEKLIQLGVFAKDAQGRFRPHEPMDAREFATALARVLGLAPGTLPGVTDASLTREAMGAMLADAYAARFKAKPAYMTDYNGNTVLPGSPGYDPNLDSGARGAMYYPLVGWDELLDTAAVDARRAGKVRQAYELGLIRSETGIARGRMVNGRELEPKAVVTRAKAAKALYFMWVLGQPPKGENDVVRLK